MEAWFSKGAVLLMGDAQEPSKGIVRRRVLTMTVPSIVAWPQLATQR